MSIKRIAIIGNSGSGKSYLADKLHQLLRLPVYHLDKYCWKPGWTKLEYAEFKHIHDALCGKDKWIIEGMNLKSLEHRLQRADMIIFLDISRSVCLWHVFKRLLKHYGSSEPHAAEGCPQELSWQFWQFVRWVWNFKKQVRPKIYAALKSCADQKQIYILKSKKEVDQFLCQYLK